MYSTDFLLVTQVLFQVLVNMYFFQICFTISRSLSRREVVSLVHSFEDGGCLGLEEMIL